MTTNSLPQFHPLTGHLPPGIHTSTHEQFRDRCVDSLKAGLFWSNCREEMFAGYERLVEALSMVNVETHELIGGSFVSKASEPNDIDLVNFCDVHAYEKLAPEIRAMLNQYFRGQSTTKHCHCDSYFAPLPPAGLEDDEDFLIIRNYWHQKLGRNAFGREKGMIGRALPSPAEDDNEERTHAAVA